MPHLPAAGTDTPDAGNVRLKNRKMAPGRWLGCLPRMKRPDPKLLLLGLRQGDLFGLQAFGTALDDEGYPLASMAEKCTNTSSPLSRWINPKPFPALNHFTVPVSFTFSPCCYFVIGV